MTLTTPPLAPARDGAAPLPRPLTAAELAKAPPRLRQTVQEFEAQALARLLQPAFATLDTSRSPFSGGPAEAPWRPMLVEAIAAKAVRAGQGLGLSDLVLRELLRRQAAPPPEETRP
jgi:hypothetical protein